MTPSRTTDKDPQEVLVLRLTARGPVVSPSDVEKGLNLGHRVIVESFDSLISQKARTYWKRHDNPNRQ